MARWHLHMSLCCPSIHFSVSLLSDVPLSWLTCWGISPPTPIRAASCTSNTRAHSVLSVHPAFCVRLSIYFPPASLRLTFSQCICLPTPSVCQYAPTLTRSGPVQARWEVLCAGGCVLVLACACACVCARTCLKKTKLSTHATCLSPFIIRVGVLALVFLSTFISRETIEILQSLIWFSSVLKMLLECKYIIHTHKSKEKENNSEELTTSGQPDQAGFVLRHHIFKVSGFHREEIKTGLPASNWKVKYTDNFPYHISELHTSFCCRATQSKICYYSLLEEKKKLY